jgi:hypothetical protein
MKLHRRYHGSVNWSANGFETFELPRNYVYSALQFVLVADIDRTAGSDGTCKDSAPAQLVKQLEVVLNGKNTIKRMDMETLHRQNQIRHGVRPWIYAHNLLGYAALDDDISKVAAQLDFELPRNGPWRQNVDCLLDARALSSLDLNITFGQAADLANDAHDSTWTVNSAKLHIYSLERVGAPVANYATWKEYKLRSHTLSGAGELTIDIPVNATYESIFVKTHSDGDQVDTIIPFGTANTNLIELYSGSEKYISVPAGLLQAINRVDAQIEVPERVGSGAALNHAQQELLLEGYYWLNFVHDGLLTEMLDTTRLGDLKLMADCAVPGTQDVVDIYMSEIIMPPAAAPQGQAA